MITTLPAPPLPAATRPALRLLGLTLLVLTLHALLLQGVWRWPNGLQDPARTRLAPASMRSVTLLPWPQRLPAPEAALPAPPPAATPAATPTAAIAPKPVPPPAKAVVALVTPTRVAPPGGAQPWAETLASTARSATPQAAPRLPQPMTLVYTAQRGAHAGEATLDWAPASDGSYRLSLRLALAGRPESAWVSTGHTGPEGLAPERMVEERRQRPVKAINFQRDKGLISFSSSTSTVALQPGGQDRISWLVQLSGLAQALNPPLAVGTTLNLQVATVGGLAENWHFRVDAAEVLPLGGQPAQAAWLLVREPQRPYDQRIEVWLAKGQELLPVQLRMTPVPAGEPLLLGLRWPLAAALGP